MVKLTRREFLKAAASTGLLASLGLATLQPMKVEAHDYYWDRFYKATVRHGVCGICGSACAFKAYVEGDGYLVDMKGKEGDLESQGGLCAKGNAGIWYVYDPDRLKYPLKRTNPEKGIGVDPEWVRISWDEALDLVANKFLEIKEKYGGHSIIFLGHPPYKPWLTRLAYALGSPNYISHLDTCVITNVLVRKFTMYSPTFVHDIKNARYILCFGWDQPAKGKVVYTHQYSEAVRNKAKIVVLNPLYTPTASKASQWIPIKPGTDLAFALAMMNVIINEGLYDEDYVNKYTNFPDHEDEIRSWVQQYTPEWAEDITEVPADTIRTVAREFATTKPSVALTHKRDAAGPNYANSWKLAHAIVILNALVGAIDNVGGVILPRAFKMPNVNKIYSMPPAPSVTEKADGKHLLPLLNKLGHGIFSTLIGNILEEKPYPIKAALVCGYNILSFPNPKKAVEAFKKLEFLAVVDILPSEMALLADVVLPDTTYWEVSGLSLRSYNALYPQIAIKDAVIKPMYDVKSHTWIIYQIGRRVAPEYFNFSLSELSSEMVRRAGIANSVEELKSMAVNGLYTPPGASFKPLEKLESLVSQGKKIQVYGETFAKYGYDPLPSWEPKREEKSLEYPYYLIVTRSAVHRHGKTVNIPWLHEICPENCVLIHPEEAEALGIKDLDWVYVESRYGKIKVKALCWPGIRRDCVCVSHGFGHWSRYMRVAYGWGANDGDLIPDQSIDEVLSRRDPTANALMSDVCVKVYRA